MPFSSPGLSAVAVQEIIEVLRVFFNFAAIILSMIEPFVYGGNEQLFLGIFIRKLHNSFKR